MPCSQISWELLNYRRHELHVTLQSCRGELEIIRKRTHPLIDDAHIEQSIYSIGFVRIIAFFTHCLITLSYFDEFLTTLLIRTEILF